MQIYAKTLVFILFFCIENQLLYRKEQVCKHQAFVITRVTFVDLQLLLADSLTIGSGFPAMTERSRLPDTLRWQTVGWMEMGLSQADASRRLKVSRNVVHSL